MKFSKLALAAAASAAVATATILGSPVAVADEATTQSIGEQGTLTNGDVVQGWTITGLKVSSDQIPHAVQGTLWEATATNEAISGTVTPIISNLNARAGDGDNYRVLFGVATPQGINPSTLAQGQKASGKVYFDVTGADPDSVVYRAGNEDLLVWVEPAPAAPVDAAPSAPSPRSATTGTAPAESPAATATDAEAPTEAPTGSQGTPLPEGSQGTPLPEGTEAGAEDTTTTDESTEPGTEGATEQPTEGVSEQPTTQSSPEGDNRHGTPQTAAPEAAEAEVAPADGGTTDPTLLPTPGTAPSSQGSQVS